MGTGNMIRLMIMVSQRDVGFIQGGRGGIRLDLKLKLLAVFPEHGVWDSTDPKWEGWELGAQTPRTRSRHARDAFREVQF